MAAGTASNYDKQQLAEDFAHFKERNPWCLVEKQTMTSLAGSLAGKEVLDVACGHGFYARAWQSGGAKRVVGVDISTDMISLAREKEAAAPLGIMYAIGDAMHLGELGIGDFDVATAGWLLNYLKDESELTACLRSVARVLRPQGRFVGVTTSPVVRSTPESYFKVAGQRWVTPDDLGDSCLVGVQLDTWGAPSALAPRRPVMRTPRCARVRATGK